MKFETNLSRQDKRTIAIVLYLAVIALFIFYFIRPAWVQLGTLDDQIKTAKETQEINRNKITQLSSAESLYDRAVTDITESVSVYYDVMDNSEIEKMITEYILDFGLTPVNLTIDIRDSNQYVNESPYEYADVQTGSSSASAVTATPTPAADEEEEEDSSSSAAISTSSTDVQSLLVSYTNAVNNCTSTTYSEVQRAKISVVIMGSGTIEQQLIDDITKNPSIRVTGFSWGSAAPVEVVNEDGTTSVVNSGYRNLTIDFYFYMADKPDYEAEDQAAEEG